jgi:hypothetical protein
MVVTAHHLRLVKATAVGLIQMEARTMVLVVAVELLLQEVAEAVQQAGMAQQELHQLFLGLL